MRMAMVGLGKMGANMVRRLRQGGIEVIGFNRSRDIIDELAREVGMEPADSLQDAVGKLTAPRVIWLMLPAGSATEQTIGDLAQMLEPGDLVIDGGNANYHDSQRRGEKLAAKGIHFIDAGTSGGIWGLEVGYCLMVGGEKQAVELLAPALRVLAPDPDKGWGHMGPVGSGHFVKMIHNGIEYGMMQAFAEGFALLKGKSDFNLDLAQISELWRHGSVIRSWLLDLTADALQADQTLESVAPYVADSGEGRWTVDEAVEQGVPAPVLSLALMMRFASQDQVGFPNRLLAMMRNAFGGHMVARK